MATRYVRRRREHLILTAAGGVLHTYGGAKLGLLSVSSAHPGYLSCLAADAYHAYTAAGAIIYAWRRGNELKHVYKGHEADVKLLLPFGPHLIAVDAHNVMKVS